MVNPSGIQGIRWKEKVVNQISDGINPYRSNIDDKDGDGYTPIR